MNDKISNYRCPGKIEQKIVVRLREAEVIIALQMFQSLVIDAGFLPAEINIHVFMV